FFQRYISRRSVRNSKFESITQDKVAVLVNDGIIDPKQLMKTRISRARVFSQLRSEGIMHLGMVKKLYIEAGGTFSLLKATEVIPGLTVLPKWDDELIAQQDHQSKMLVCSFCGYSDDRVGEASCPNCDNKDWTIAVK
ncbi:MAG: DUF421 domain-containing protein, partial [Sphingobacteriales bacterium]